MPEQSNLFVKKIMNGLVMINCCSLQYLQICKFRIDRDNRFAVSLKKREYITIIVL